jgi:hypothetical protein
MMRGRPGWWLLPAALTCGWCVAPPAGAQAIGPEFRVNSYTTGQQQTQSVAAAADGRFVVTWDSIYQDGSGFGVFGQRYDSNGSPVGPEFRVHSFTTGNQLGSSVAAAADGRFVVTWWSNLQDGSYEGVFGQRHDSNGAPLGSEFRVNSYTAGRQYRPSVAAAADGRFVVTWESSLTNQDGSSYGVFGQRYDSNGAAVGTEFRVNSYTTDIQRWSSVGLAADGRFVVTWQSQGQDGSGYGVFGQRYDANGAPAGPEFRVNAFTTGQQFLPSVAGAADGRFVVTWDSPQDGGSYGVFGQRYDSNGAPVGPEFRVNSYTTANQRGSAVAMAPDGRFVVTWQSRYQDGSNYGVFGQRYDANGAPVGAEFRVNSHTTGYQVGPSPAVAANGRFVVTWGRTGQGDDWGVFGRRFHLDVIFADSFQGG